MDDSSLLLSHNLISGPDSSMVSMHDLVSKLTIILGLSWRCHTSSFGEQASFEYFVYRLEKSSEYPLLVSENREKKVWLEDCMHEYLDGEEFLNHIKL